MGIVEPTNTEVKSFRGFHLYHAGRSACSARVRLLLEEKRLPWTSRHIDIYQRANVTAEYFGINPKGLVPTLVHDGKVIVESNDIMLYLEEICPEPGFSPVNDKDRDDMVTWLKRSGDIHLPGIKTYAYAKQHAKNVVKTPEEVELYRTLQNDQELLDFHGKHDLPGRSFSRQDIDSAVALLTEALTEMDSILAVADWLVNNDYSLADMSWSTGFLTLQGVGFPVEDYPNVISWYQRVSRRPAFNRAVTLWREGTLEGVVEVDPDKEPDFS